MSGPNPKNYGRLQLKMFERFEARYRPIKDELIRSSGINSDFIESHHGYCRTQDEWYPNFKGWHHQYVAFYAVGVGCPSNQKPFARFMGADDSDMGREWETEAEMFKFLDELPQVVNKDFLESHGFQHGF